MRRSGPRFVGVVLTLSLAIAASSCGDDSATSRQSSPDPAAGAQGDLSTALAPSAGEIRINDYKFAPVTLAVKAGQSVSVINDDTVDHTVTAVDKTFDTGPLTKSQSAGFTLARPGDYEFICSIHPYMRAAVTVS